jgi:hypothetical protein
MVEQVHMIEKNICVGIKQKYLKIKVLTITPLKQMTKIY